MSVGSCGLPAGDKAASLAAELEHEKQRAASAEAAQAAADEAHKELQSKALDLEGRPAAAETSSQESVQKAAALQEQLAAVVEDRIQELDEAFVQLQQLLHEPMFQPPYFGLDGLLLPEVRAGGPDGVQDPEGDDASAKRSDVAADSSGGAVASEGVDSLREAERSRDESCAAFARLVEEKGQVEAELDRLGILGEVRREQRRL